MHGLRMQNGSGRGRGIGKFMRRHDTYISIEERKRARGRRAGMVSVGAME